MNWMLKSGMKWLWRAAVAYATAFAAQQAARLARAAGLALIGAYEARRERQKMLAEGRL